MSTTQCTEEDPLRVAIYVRISEDPDDTQIGIEQQEADCHARVIREEDWQVAAIYRENDVGASTRTRKARKKWPRMLDAAKRGEFDAILAYSNSRLLRDPDDIGRLIRLHEEHGTLLRTVVSGDDDLSTADGRLMARLKADIDTAESERISERLKRRQQTNRENGGQGTKRAFGWMIEHERDGHGQPVLGRQGKPIRKPDPLHPVEGPALAEGLRMIREDGASIGQVARFWNSKNLTTVSGTHWTTPRTREALIRWRNCAVIVHNGTPTEYAGAWEPICTREDLEEVRALLNADRKRPGKRGRPASALLSGIATCGKCGRSLYTGRQATRRGGELHYFGVYRCSGSQSQTGEKCWTTVKKEILDQVVVQALLHKQMSTPPGEQPKTPESAHLSVLRADLNAVQASVDRLVESVASGALTGDDIASKRADMEKEKQGLQSQIDALLMERAELRMTAELSKWLWIPGKISLLDAADVQKRLREIFECLDREQQRTLVRSLGPITLHPKSAEKRIQVGKEWF